MSNEAFSIQFDFRALKAATFCASSEETRYYLKGVFAEYKDGELILVATDGHRLLAVHPENNGPAPHGPAFGIIIPLDAIARIKINKYATQGDLVCEAGQWALHYEGIKIGFTPIDGTFPDWRRIVPSETSGEAAQFNAAYLNDFAKASKLLGGDTRPVVAYNGEGPALIGFQSDIEAFGVLMPFRASIVPTNPPSWLYPSRVESESKEAA